MLWALVGIGLPIVGWGCGGARDGLFTLGLALAIGSVAVTALLLGAAWAAGLGLGLGVLLYVSQRVYHG